MKTEFTLGPGVVRVAIPMAGETYSHHFGGATEFWIFEGTRDSADLKEDLLSAPRHEPGVLPRWLADRRVDAVVVSQIGERALIMLADAGIRVFSADGELAPADMARACLRGRLPQARWEDSCRGGHHHDHDHDHSHHCRH